MGISTKRRRRITVDDREYLWWVQEDPENYYAPYQPGVRVATEDRRLLVRYHLGQSGEHRHVTVLGPEFRGLPGLGGPWRRYRCPAFGSADSFRPADAAALIRWCAEAGAPPLEVDFRGNLIARVKD
ncbi:hypothetical protein [Nocardia sp. NPDC052566]|uniref:hypothetical protein n=1 Tax=Nocardia sp. NPDC052566 TaxID=3364330 RepID=UPI0037C8A6EB